MVCLKVFVKTHSRKESRGGEKVQNDAEIIEAGKTNDADLKGFKEGKKFVCWQH